MVIVHRSCVATSCVRTANLVNSSYFKIITISPSYDNKIKILSIEAIIINFCLCWQLQARSRLGVAKVLGIEFYGCTNLTQSQLHMPHGVLYNTAFVEEVCNLVL